MIFSDLREAPVTVCHRPCSSRPCAGLRPWMRPRACRAVSEDSWRRRHRGRYLAAHDRTRQPAESRHLVSSRRHARFDDDAETFHGSEGQVHADGFVGVPVSIDATFFQPEEMVGYIRRAGVTVGEIVERPPYDFEYQSTRAGACGCAVQWPRPPSQIGSWLFSPSPVAWA
jgi:hypothetical protein